MVVIHIVPSKIIISVHFFQVYVSNSPTSSKATSSVSSSVSSAIVTAVSEESNEEYTENALTKFEPCVVS